MINLQHHPTECSEISELRNITGHTLLFDPTQVTTLQFRVTCAHCTTSLTILHIIGLLKICSMCLMFEGNLIDNEHPSYQCDSHGYLLENFVNPTYNGKATQPQVKLYRLEYCLWVFLLDYQNGGAWRNGLIPTLICVIRLPLRIGGLFIHAIYLGSKPYHKTHNLVNVVAYESQ